MIRAIATLAIGLLLAAARPDAHALDEYVQALRVEVASDRVTLHLGLTPGVAVAARILEAIDLDRSGVLEPEEARRYGDAVLSDLQIAIDGAPRVSRLVLVDAASAGEIRDGVGTIRIEAAVDGALATGPHVIVVRNGHNPVASAYLANALLPDDAAIRVARQERDPDQQVFRLHVEVAAGRRRTVEWSMAGAALLLAHAGWRRRRAASVS